MHFSTFFLFFPLFFCALFEIPGSKDQNVVLACKIRHLNLGPAKHEEVAIYAVNMRIPNVFVILRVQSTEKSRMAHGYRQTTGEDTYE